MPKSNVTPSLRKVRHLKGKDQPSEDPLSLPWRVNNQAYSSETTQNLPKKPWNRAVQAHPVLSQKDFSHGMCDASIPPTSSSHQARRNLIARLLDDEDSEDFDADNFERTVAEHNRYAGTGVDEAFGRGSSTVNRFNGDPSNKPNPCMRPIGPGPFYAMAVWPAAIDGPKP